MQSRNIPGCISSPLRGRGRGRDRDRATATARERERERERSSSFTRLFVPCRIHFFDMGGTQSSQAVPQTSIHEFTVKDVTGKDVDLNIYKGKVLLVVNVASKCGFTKSNYTQFSELYTKYKDQDFEILAFPCNQFGSQEPGTNEEIQEFACTRYKAEFPIFDKIEVNGENEAPIYKFLKANSKGGLFGPRISWNFTKFLIDKDGRVVGRYAPTTSPMKIEKDIKALLEVR